MNFRRPLFVTLLCLGVLPTAVLRAQSPNAMDKLAISEVQALAEKGSVEAQHSMGRRFDLGLNGVKVDPV